ncbi:MAG: DUF2155 domain-containing protein [Rickettsiaceae bacterium]|nr:DUF2155 domain-containing protein [Rickettsiaceae bacterium]
MKLFTRNCFIFSYLLICLNVKATEDINIFGLEKNSNGIIAKGSVIILNKITANSKKFVVNLGDKVTYENAEITLHKCAKTSDGESALLVTLKEGVLNDREKVIFDGWIFSSSPSISAPEHPVYMLMAIACS